MELAFESKDLRSICELGATAEHELGAEVAEVLRRRLADLRAATSIYDLVAGNPHEVEFRDINYFIVDLSEDYQIVLKANHSENPLTNSGQIDWAKVSRIKVTHIGGEYEH